MSRERTSTPTSILWFLSPSLKARSLLKKQLEKKTSAQALLQEAKQLGFSDSAIRARAQNRPKKRSGHSQRSRGNPPFRETDRHLSRRIRRETNYLYTTYRGDAHDISSQAMIARGHPRLRALLHRLFCRIRLVRGQMARTLRKMEKTTILINSNPETVSTDFDESDRLYFEELTLERVHDIADFEKPEGNRRLCRWPDRKQPCDPARSARLPLLGTSPHSIDLAENRKKFSSLLHMLESTNRDGAASSTSKAGRNLRPKWATLSSSVPPMCSPEPR